MALGNTHNNFLEKSKIRFSDLVNQTQDYLVRTYQKARATFTPASPFGQILSVLQNLTQMVFYYIEDALVELNIFTAFKERSVYGLARLAGHNPTRAISARGTFAMNIKTGAQGELGIPYLFITNNTRIMNENTGLNYIVKVDNVQGRIKIDLTVNDIFYFRVIQGEVEEQTVIADGRNLQSYNFNSPQSIEQDNVFVFVNGEQYGIADSLYDMTKDEKSCILKTGINDGIDIYFGNEDFGTVPSNGSNITVQYITTAGIRGNLYANSDILTWKFTDKGSSNIGEDVDLNEVFNVSVASPLVLGSPEESLDLTRLIAPRTSRALVLANSDNYVAFLSRFDFSYVNAYNTYDDEYLDDDNVVYLFLIPNVQSKLSLDSDYYTTAETNFVLSTDEKNALITYIQKSGRQIVSTELSVVDPILTRYVLNISLRIFSGVDVDSLRSDILALIASYFINVQRRDKVPKSDIISLLETVSGVDSVNIEFISQVNEEALINGYYYKTVYTIDSIRSIRTPVTTQVNLQKSAPTSESPNGTVIENPQLGLDKFGDIQIGLNEMPIIRGGWTDHNGVYINTDIKNNNISSVNIMVDEIIPEDLSQQIMSQNKNILMSNERKKS